MARSRSTPAKTKRSSRYLFYSIPIIALLGIGVVFALLTAPPPPVHLAVDFTFELVLQTQITNSSGHFDRGLIPNNAIGEAGGYWRSSQFNGLGPDSTHYPLYMDPPATACPAVVCNINVKSRVAYNYTLGDFFNVWGVPLSKDNTWNLQSNGSYAWMLCIGTGSSAVVSNEWGALVLKPNMQLTLQYFDYANGLGCGPS